MPLFHHKSEEEKQADARARELQTEHQADQVASIESLQQGGLPVQAKRRLAELAKNPNHLFTSDLSVSEFLLTRHEGLKPITQVMGSCFYHVGYSGLLMRGMWTGSSEMHMITQAYDNARDLALGRLREEAEMVGASAVIGVRLKKAEYEWGSDTIEYTAVGTAVHVEGAAPAEQVALTTLTGEDYWKLLQAGYGPVGVAGGNCVYYQVGWDTTNINYFWSGGWANREIGDLTQGIRAARYIAQQGMHNSAGRVGADGVVGVTIERHQREHEVEMQDDTRRTDMIFTFLTMGTAVARLKIARPQSTPKLVVPLSGRGLSRIRPSAEFQGSESE
ncbi:MAG TPA: heavy metal-binding domain-containing protein [Chloroflexota bacterium]|jgi:uncharacterized protein YbjQ (UPF0145 family)|nr:heavy metal-binding domain-containing protein [Chloroflexota bacterium]